MATVQRPLLLQISESSLNAGGRRWIDKDKRQRISQTHALHLQEQNGRKEKLKLGSSKGELLCMGWCYLENEGVQSHSVDFRHWIRCKGIVVRLRVEAVTHPWTRPAGSTFPLLCAGSADPELLQTLHLGFRIEAHFFDLSCKTRHG